MKQLLIEAICNNCDLIVYSTEFYMDCVHYCPECGDKLDVTHEKYQLQDNAIKAKYYFSRERMQKRVISLRKKGFTLREIAGDLGISHMTVQRMVQNKVLVTRVTSFIDNQQLSFNYPGINDRMAENIPDTTVAASSSNPMTTPMLTGNNRTSFKTNPHGLSR